MGGRKGKLKELRNHCSSSRSFALTQLLRDFSAGPGNITDSRWLNQSPLCTLLHLLRSKWLKAQVHHLLGLFSCPQAFFTLMPKLCPCIFLSFPAWFKKKLSHWPWNWLLCPSLLQYVSYQGMHLILQTKIALVEEKTAEKKYPGIFFFSIHYSIFIGIDLVPGKIWTCKKLSLLLNYSPGLTFCESISFKGDSGDKFISRWTRREGPIKII